SLFVCFFFSSRRRHTRWPRDWSSDVCTSDLGKAGGKRGGVAAAETTLRLYLWRPAPPRFPPALPRVGQEHGLGTPVSSARCRDEVGRASCRESVAAPVGSVVVRRGVVGLYVI